MFSMLSRRRVANMGTKWPVQQQPTVTYCSKGFDLWTEEWFRNRKSNEKFVNFWLKKWWPFPLSFRPIHVTAWEEERMFCFGLDPELPTTLISHSPKHHLFMPGPVNLSPHAPNPVLTLVLCTQQEIKATPWGPGSSFPQHLVKTKS